jgi:hypothetical protein
MIEAGGQARPTGPMSVQVNQGGGGFGFNTGGFNMGGFGMGGAPNRCGGQPGQSILDFNSRLGGGNSITISVYDPRTDQRINSGIPSSSEILQPIYESYTVQGILEVQTNGTQSFDSF